MPDTPEPAPIVNANGEECAPFADFVRTFRRGSVHHDLSVEFHDLLAEVVAHEKAGTLTLTVAVVPVGDLQVEIRLSSSSKAPKAAPAAGLFFIDRSGNPSRNDPYQDPLPFNTPNQSEEDINP